MKSVTSRYLLSFYESCIEQGASKAELLALIPGGLKGLQDPERRFSTKTLVRVVTHSENTTGVHSIGLNAGENFRPDTFGDIGQAIMFCRSLRQVVMVNRCYQPITQQFGRSSLKIKNKEAWILWHCDTAPEQARVITDAIMANHAQFGRWLTWDHSKKINAMHFRHKKPSYAQLYEELFGCPIYFEQEQDAMVVNFDFIDAPLPQANAGMLAQVRQKLDIQLEALDAPMTCSDQVADYIESVLARGAPTLEGIAAEFRLSPRTLRRRLLNEQSSYRDILETLRHEKCEHYMFDNDVPLFKISELLGYSEQSAFNHAFKTWYGKTPKMYLRALKLFDKSYEQLLGE